MSHINLPSNHHSKETCEPFQIAPHVYYVGVVSSGCLLFDTGVGLVLLDQTRDDTVPLVLENIRKLGFNLSDIRALLVSHGHADHCGGTRTFQSLTNAIVYMSRDDFRMIHDTSNQSTPDKHLIPYFEPNRFYNDNRAINIGRFSIKALLTPGHTPGTTSFFFRSVDEKSGRSYQYAMHIELGLDILKNDWLRKKSSDSFAIQSELTSKWNMMERHKIDIALPYHADQLPLFHHLDLSAEGRNTFESPEAWTPLIQARIRRSIGIGDSYSIGSTSRN